MYLKPTIAPNITGPPDIVTTLPEESTQHFLPVPREPQKDCEIPTHTQEDIIGPAHFPTIFKPPKEVRILAICSKFVKTFTSKRRKCTPGNQNLIPDHSEYRDPPPPTQYGLHNSCFSKLVVACFGSTDNICL